MNEHNGDHEILSDDGRAKINTETVKPVLEVDSEESDDGVFPSSAWAVKPSVLKAQLTSPAEIFIRLVWAPFLLVTFASMQLYAFDEFSFFGILAMLITMPFICWSLAAMLFTNEYRKDLTETFSKELPVIMELGTVSFDVLFLLLRGAFHVIGLAIRAIFHAIT